MTPIASAVFDCMVFLQGAASATGPAGACLELVELGYVELHVSEEIITEIREVLSRPKIRNKFPALTDDRVSAFLKRIQQKAVVSGHPPKSMTFERDPKDEKYLNLAAITGATFLVTRDNDLLDLRNEGNPARENFRKACPHTQVVDPPDFLAAIRELTLGRPSPSSD